MTMTTMLISVAEFSNVLSVIAVLLCFLVMILFITRSAFISLSLSLSLFSFFFWPLFLRFHLFMYF